MDYPPARPTGVFVSAGPRARWTVGLMIAGICLDVVAIGSGMAQTSLINRALSGLAVTRAEATANDLRESAIGVTQVALAITTAIVFLLWLRRSYANLAALTTRPRKYSLGWVVGGFFVPFLNLVRPYQVVRELWRLSDDTPDDKDVPSPSLLGWWWGFWLLTNVAGQAAFRMAMGAKTAQEILTATHVNVAANVVSIVCAALAIPVVRTIERKQASRAMLAARVAAGA
jgi:Domain of unknown function (DUF4328)